MRRVRISSYAVAGFWLGVSGAYAAEFPVKDAASAIAIAKAICLGKADASLKWEAVLDGEGKTWSADTIPSVKSSFDHLWIVKIPVNGPLPITCAQAGVWRDTIGPSPAQP